MEILDVTSQASVDAAFERTPRPCGCARQYGIGGATPLELTPLDEHRAILTNYFGAMRCIHAVLGSMGRRTGSIVNTSVEATPRHPQSSGLFLEQVGPGRWRRRWPGVSAVGVQIDRKNRGRGRDSKLTPPQPRATTRPLPTSISCDVTARCLPPASGRERPGSGRRHHRRSDHKRRLPPPLARGRGCGGDDRRAENHERRSLVPRRTSGRGLQRRVQGALRIDFG